MLHVAFNSRGMKKEGSGKELTKKEKRKKEADSGKSHQETDSSTQINNSPLVNSSCSRSNNIYDHKILKPQR